MCLTWSAINFSCPPLFHFLGILLLSSSQSTAFATITATANYGPEGRKRERESIRSFYFGQFGTLSSLPGLIWGSGLFIEVNSDVESPVLPFSPHLIYRPDAVCTFHSVVQVFWFLIGGR